MPVSTIEILRRSLPLGLANMTVVLMPLLDSIMLGRHGTDSLAAGGLAMQIYIAIFILGEGLVIGFSTIYGKYLEMNLLGEIHDLTCALYLLLSVLAIIAITVAIFSQEILTAFGQSEDLINASYPYLILLSFAILPNFLLIHFWEILSYQLKERKIIEGVSLQLLSNTAINYLLISGNYGAPELGPTGAGIGTFCGSIIGSSWLYISIQKEAQPYLPIKCAAKVARQAGLILKKGLPIGLAIVSTVAYLSLSVIFMGWYSHAALAAHIAVLQVNELVIVFILGFADYCTLHTAERYKRDTRSSYVAFARKTCMIALGVMTLILLTIYISRHIIYGIFFTDSSPDHSLKIFMAEFLSFSSSLLMLNGVTILLMGLLRGRAVTFGPLIATIIGIWGVGAFSQITLMALYPGRPIVIWVGMQIGFAATALGLLWCLYTYVQHSQTLNQKIPKL